MPRQIFKNGKWCDKEEKSTVTATSKAPVVMQDSMQPLRHLATGKYYDSKSKFRATTKRLGLVEVGNDLLSNKSRNIKDSITEERVLDAIQKAESICNDPTKRREYENRNRERLEKMERLLKNGAGR